MGTQCPQCSTMVDTEFGMAQCPSCQSVFYVNLDGSVKVSDETPDPSAELEAFSSQPEDVASPEPGNFDAVEFDPNLDEINSTGEEEPSSEDSPWGAPAWDDSPVSEPVETLSEEVEESVDFPVNEAVDSWEQVETPQEEPIPAIDNSWGVEEPEPVNEGPKNLESLREEVVDYGNSEVSSAKTGILLYNLKIQGLDTAKEKEILRDVLSDKKLLLSVESLFSAITNGELVIDGLNPVKASMIVSGLYNTGLDVTWSQEAINE